MEKNEYYWRLYQNLLRRLEKRLKIIQKET